MPNLTAEEAVWKASNMAWPALETIPRDSMIPTSLEMMKMYMVGEFENWLFLFKVLKLPNSSLQPGL